MPIVTYLETLCGQSGSLLIEGATFAVLYDARVRRAPGRLGKIEADLSPGTGPHQLGQWVNGKNGILALQDGRHFVVWIVTDKRGGLRVSSESAPQTDPE
jgi:hypothetical protein